MPDTAVAPLTTRAFGWWTNRSNLGKAGIVAGGVVGASLLTWGIIRLSRPDPIRDIAEGCNDFAFANQAEVEKAILPMLRNAQARAGIIDPFSVTTAFLKRYAPDCRSYPEEARNVGEADLYVQTFVKVVQVMEGERMLSPDQKLYFWEMVSVWGRNQGLTETQLPAPQAPGEQGGVQP
jgi:hypothetical protein